MNDLFAAQLRKHLLETADERPADGQLTAVIDAVETIRQQHPIHARLTLTPGRSGPMSSTVVRYGLIAAALIGAALAGALVGGAGGPSGRTVFEGAWTTTDPADGSGMFLVVASGMEPAVYFEDAYATGGACVADDVKRFTADGIGTVVDDRLDVEWPGGGGCGLLTVEMDDGHYGHDPTTDTLVDGDGLIWSRMSEADVSPTPPPATEPSATTASEPDPTPGGTIDDLSCVDLADGGTYTGPAGPHSLTATVASAPSVAWQGVEQEFYLSGRCGSTGPVAFLASAARTVLATSCMPEITESASFAEAVARLDTPTGDDIAERVDLVIDGHPAVRYDIVELRSCPEGFGLWHGTTIGAGETGSLYVIDVDGSLVAIEYRYGGSATPEEIDEGHAIIATLQFD